MAKDKSITPEQQLLKLIEENKASKGTSPGLPGKIFKSPVWFPLPKIPGLLAGRLSFWKRNTVKGQQWNVRKISLDIVDINKALIVAVACLLVYVVFDAAASARNLYRSPNFTPAKDTKTAVGKAEVIEPLKEASYYLQKISSRDIFKEGKKIEQAKPKTPALNVVGETADEVKNLSLVGISWSSNPDAILEDKSNRRTFFVKQGQMVGNSVKLEAIFKDHVVVTFEDREYELR
jgi:hypothetical protein